LPLIGNYLLDSATIHAQERGFGYEMMLKNNCAWVLSRMAIEIYEYPQNEDIIYVETWVEDVTRFFTQRSFRLKNDKDQVIGYSRTIWAAININTRRPIDILAWHPDLTDFIDNTIDCPIEKPCKILQTHTETPVLYTVKYSDIDINKHMNSLKYIEHDIDMFELDILEKKNIKRFEIMYLAESSFGDELTFYKQQVNADEYLIETKKNGISVCRSRIFWE
jgi:acyl-ACP thioesterase